MLGLDLIASSQFADLNKFISAAAIFAFFGQFVFIFNFFYSIFRGRRATRESLELDYAGVDYSY